MTTEQALAEFKARFGARWQIWTPSTEPPPYPLGAERSLKVVDAGQ